MRIPGFLTDTLFYLRTLTIISVSSIALQTFVVVKGTSEENTSTNIEKPRGKSRRVKSESDWKRYYGSSKELADDVATQGKISFKRDILAYINLRDSQTLKRPDNFFSTMYLRRRCQMGHLHFTIQTSLVGTCEKIISTLDRC